MSKQKLKSVPKFRNEAEERRFWETHNSTDYVDWRKSRTRALAQSQAVHHCDFSAATGHLAGTHQSRRQQARRSLSIADQDLACR